MDRANFSKDMKLVLAILAEVREMKGNFFNFLSSFFGGVQMKQRIVDATFVQQHLKTPGYKIIDARAPVFYDGVQAGMGQAPANMKGHLPGARSIPFSSVTNTDLSLKSPEELANLFKAAGVEKGDRVIAYCHIGAQATAVVFAARSLGIDAVLYDGSFQDWARRGLPVETPAAQ